MTERPYVLISKRQLLGAVIALFVTLGLMIGVSILYTNYVDRQSNQAWCELFNGLDKRYQALQNPDPDAIEFRQQLARLKDKYDC